MVECAIILAAGLGSRLKEKTKEKPKGFLEIEGVSLIQRSVEILIECGIKKIYIGTGYLSEVYDDFAKNYPQIETIKSEKFKTTSSMFTLYNMKKEIKNDFLLLESDLLYEKKAITTLLEDNKKDIILASGKTDSNDEVYIECDENFNLLNMSKQKDKLNKIDAELVGISKISYKNYQLMNKCFEKIAIKNPKIDYEYILVKISKTTPIKIKKIKNLTWCEIDNKEHLKRALEVIYPKIRD